MKQVRQRFLNRMSFENVLVEALMGAGSLAVLTSGAVLVSQGDSGLRSAAIVDAVGADVVRAGLGDRQDR